MRTYRTSYSNGAPYRPARGRYPETVAATITALPLLSLQQHTTWPSLWEAVRTQLRQRGFQDSTLRLYRQVLRSFRSHLATDYAAPRPQAKQTSPSGFSFPVSSFSSPPFGIRHSAIAISQSPIDIRQSEISSFIDSLVARQTSASWLSTNIAVLRTVFDKLADRDWTRSIPTPKSGFHLPCILSANEIARLIEATPSIRDRLLIGFLHGCGMRTGEVTRLRWREINLETRSVTIGNPHTDEYRAVPLPDSILPVLVRGKALCKPDDLIFPGTKEGRMISERTIERAIRRSARAAGLVKPVNCMTLRHSYAVACLKAGVNIREVQEAIGHKRIQTTLRYQDMLIAGQFSNCDPRNSGHSCESSISLGVPSGRPAASPAVSDSTAQSSSSPQPLPSLPLSSSPQFGNRQSTISNSCNPETLPVDYKLNAYLAAFPFADIPFDFRTVFRSIRHFFSFG